MNKKRLGLNTFTGFLNIVGCLVSIALIFIASAAIINKTPVPSYVHIINYVIIIILLVFNIWSMTKSKSNNISIIGHILGIAGSLVLLINLSIGIILLIVSAIFLFIQKNHK
ncbi:hypothetical protein [Apilactobacillus quenuiae]|uniref:hypothetical protein n=1 Tax=Apilactobacillus quenuiae TaxID=2008377 RepID=UPI000D02153A|nr:hypothetical protein [Apilactobacillus quenuiae]